MMLRFATLLAFLLVAHAVQVSVESDASIEAVSKKLVRSGVKAQKDVDEDAHAVQVSVEADASIEVVSKKLVRSGVKAQKDVDEDEDDQKDDPKDGPECSGSRKLVSEQPGAIGKKRWCGHLKKTDKATCEGSYTYKRCSTTVGQDTVYYKCKWNDDGQPGKPGKKCFASGQFTCSAGVGGAADPCKDVDTTPPPTPEPTPAPTPEPTPAPTPEPTPEPTPAPAPESTSCVLPLDKNGVKQACADISGTYVGKNDFGPPVSEFNLRQTGCYGNVRADAQGWMYMVKGCAVDQSWDIKGTITGTAGSYKITWSTGSIWTEKS